MLMRGKRYGQRRNWRRIQRKVFSVAPVYMSLELSSVVTAIIRQLMTRRFEIIEFNLNKIDQRKRGVGARVG